MQVTNHDPDDIFVPRKDFTITVEVDRGVKFSVQDTTYQYAEVRVSPSEARELAAALIAAADEAERGQG